MTDTALIIAIVCLAYIGAIMLLCRFAPEGWEDHEGWHAGRPGGDE